MGGYPSEAVQDALDRMRRAYDRETGCRLTAEMVAALGLTFLAEVWSEDRPAKEQQTRAEAWR